RPAVSLAESLRALSVADRSQEPLRVARPLGPRPFEEIDERLLCELLPVFARELVMRTRQHAANEREALRPCRAVRAPGVVRLHATPGLVPRSTPDSRSWVV